MKGFLSVVFGVALIALSFSAVAEVAIPSVNIMAECASATQARSATDEMMKGCYELEAKALTSMRSIWERTPISAKAACVSRYEKGTPEGMIYQSMYGCILGEMDGSASMEASVKKQALDLQSFNPVASGWAAGHRDWRRLGESESMSVYYAYAPDSPGTAIGIKVAKKGLGDSYTQIQVVTGSLQCGALGSYPASLENAVITEYNPTTGAPIGFGDSQGMGATIPIERGTVLAKAVLKICDVVASR